MLYFIRNNAEYMPTILNIKTEPDPKLRKKSKEVPKKMIKSEEFKELCKDMESTMLLKDGVGLAAPQIGENIRLIVVNTKQGVIAMINPELSKKSWAKEWGEEGCLSVPGVFGEVRRHKNVSCKFIGLNGAEKCIEAKGLLARILQHETDHLDGILFIDKAKNLEDKGSGHKTGNSKKIKE
jgi:peptide deformylase